MTKLFPFLVLLRNAIIMLYNTLFIIQFPLCLIIRQAISYMRLIAKENFKLLDLKVVLVTYESSLSPNLLAHFMKMSICIGNRMNLLVYFVIYGHE